MNAIPTLHTERLVLRGFTRDDFEPFATIVSDPEVVRYLDDGAPISREDCRQGGDWRASSGTGACGATAGGQP